MLHGATRAARRCGARSPHHVWIIAVPVVLMAYPMARLGTFLIVYLTSLTRSDAQALLLAPGGPLTIRTAILTAFGCWTVYALVWCLGSARDVFRVGLRAIPGPDFTRAVATFLMFLLCAGCFLWSRGIPTAGQLVAEAEAELERGWSHTFEAVVEARVEGVDDLCRRLRDEGPDRYRLLAAAGLWLNGDRSPRTKASIREGVQALRRDDSKHRRWEYCAARWLSNPAARSLQREIGWLGPGSPFWEWWDAAKSRFD